jgi:hypothetical protein
LFLCIYYFPTVQPFVKSFEGPFDMFRRDLRRLLRT